MMPRHATPFRGSGLTPCRVLIILCSVLLGLAGVGCSSNKRASGASKLPDPKHVIVYDFASTPMEISPDSAFAGRLTAGSPPPTAEQAALAKQIGSKIAAQLVDELKAMGVPAIHVTVGHSPKLNDIVLRGYVISRGGEPNSASFIGLASGSSNFGAALEGFQMSLYGLNRLGSGVTSDPIGLVFSKGAQMGTQGVDGSQVDARAREIAVEIARVLKPRFQAQGWAK